MVNLLQRNQEYTGENTVYSINGVEKTGQLHGKE